MLLTGSPIVVRDPIGKLDQPESLAAVDLKFAAPVAAHSPIPLLRPPMRAELSPVTHERHRAIHRASHCANSIELRRHPRSHD